jgi:hypothetical protein
MISTEFDLGLAACAEADIACRVLAGACKAKATVASR